MNRTICDAIKRRCLIRFEYSGLTRTVEPHSHGFNTKRKEVLRGFQVAGDSTSGEAIGWKFFVVANISHLILLPTEFRVNSEGHAAATKELIIIHCMAE